MPKTADQARFYKTTRELNGRISVKAWFNRFCAPLDWRTEKFAAVAKATAKAHYKAYIQSGDYAREMKIQQFPDATLHMAPWRQSDVTFKKVLALECGAPRKPTGKHASKWAFKWQPGALEKYN